MLASTSVEVFSARLGRLHAFVLETAAVSVSIAFGTAVAIFSPTTIAGEVSLAWDASTSSDRPIYYKLTPSIATC